MPWCSIQIDSTKNYRIGNLFRFKYKLPSSLKSKILYFFPNAVDTNNSTYVGFSKLQKVRFSEYIRISPRFCKALKATFANASTIEEHIARGLCDTVNLK